MIYFSLQSHLKPTFLLSLSTLIMLTFAFVFARSIDKPNEIGILEQGLTTLDNTVNRVHAIKRELTRVSIPDNSMTLKLCHEVVSHSLLQLAYVQNTMSSMMMTADQATTAQMAVTAANTYLRTCKQALDEAGENNHGPFGSVISLLTASGTDECACSQIISQAISEIAKAPGSTTNKHPMTTQAMPGSIFESIPAMPGSIFESIPAMRRVRVAKDGSGNYTAINDAVKNAPINQNSYFLIYIEEGVYEEYVVVTIDRPYLILAGAGEGKTIITGNRSNVTGWGTYYSATVAIEAQNFIGFNLTIENTAGPQSYQAVALRTTGSFSVFYHCTISGFQDTLFVHIGYQFFRECTITGTIDFIFGDSSVVFQKCTIFLQQPLDVQQNVIAASYRNCPTDSTGISIHMSNIVATQDLKNTTISYLGRSWGQYARTAFLLSNFSVFIDPLRWCVMNGSPADVDFGEFNNSGLGGGTMAGTKSTMDKKLDQNSAFQFTVDRMLMGGNWINNTTVPYTKGLFQ